MRHALLSLLVVGCATPDPAVEADLAAKESCAASVPKDYATIQAAVDAVADGSTVCVAAGTWTENLVVAGRIVRIAGQDRKTTVLHGGGAGAVLTVERSDIELANMTVTGGVSDTGGGLDIHSSNALLEHVTFTGNLARLAGGAIAAEWTQVTATDVKLARNKSEGPGGGAWFYDATLDGDHVVFAGNVSVQSGGGGISSDNLANVWLRNSDFVGNEARGPGGNGGALEMGTTSSLLENVRIVGNVAAGNGGGIHGSGAYAPHELYNSVIAGNSAAYGGASYGGGYGHTFVLVNTLVAFNDGGMMADKFGALDASYSAFWDNTGGSISLNYADPIGSNGNFEADPMLVSTAGKPGRWDLHLQPGSPLIDAGDPALLDPDGTVSDIGLYGGPLSE